MNYLAIACSSLAIAAGCAHAQSSVTVYGIVDQGIAKTNDGTAPNPGSGTAGSDAWLAQQSIGSRLGFRGNEDMGGGLSTQFLLEHRFFPDNGTQNGTTMWWRSWVQLTSKDFGAIYLGREYAPAFWVSWKMDPWGWTTVAQSGALQWAGYGATTGGSRTANTIGYKTPKMKGLSANLATALGESPTAGRRDGFNIEYESGPLYAGIGYDRTSGGSPVVDGDSLINVGVAYNFGVVRPMFYYGRAKVNNLTNTFTSLGLQAPVGPGTLRAVAYRYNPNGSGGTETKYGLGYFYPLSKRTLVYVDASLGKKANLGATSYSNRQAVDFGIRHTF